MYTVSVRQDVFEVGSKNYVAEELLGEGAFGKVYKVREDDRSGGVYALKVIQVENQEAVKMVKREVDVLKKCNHDHIVRLCGISVSQTSRSASVLILMEYCEGGNLNSRLQAGMSSIYTSYRWMIELADAISHLHSNGIAHRDLKPENILLTGNDSIKLGDFGLARAYTVLSQSYSTTLYMHSVLGTPVWMAPEVFSGHYTVSADIYSLGLIFQAIITRTLAFVKINGQLITLDGVMTLNPGLLWELICGMLHQNPKNRPNASQVLKKLESEIVMFMPTSMNPTVSSPYVQAAACHLWT